MRKVHICIDLDDETLHSFEAQARRDGVPLQTLLERMVAGLIRDMEREEEEGTDHPIIAS